MLFKFVKNSSNRKTGNIPVVYADKATCPDTCPYKKKGCYAKYSYTNFHWNNVNITFDSLIDCIRDLPIGQFWRYAIGGDLPGINEKIDFSLLKKLVEANKRKNGFCYTHKAPVGENADAIKFANQNGFTVNLSANTLRDADEKADLNIAPVVVTLPQNAKKITFTPKGRKVIVCPKAHTKRMTCEKCKICQQVNRATIVGFPAHGVGAKEVEKIFNQA